MCDFLYLPSIFPSLSICLNCPVIEFISFHFFSAFAINESEDAKLNLNIYNRERSKEDIRIFLKEENACANVSGIVVSSAKEESDIFCKIVHEASLTNSDQKWRLLSAEKSKTSIKSVYCSPSGSF